jgi:hypothetical protein
MLTNLLGIRVMSHQGDPGQLCLSFYIAEDNLNLKPIDVEYQIFRSFWIALLDPVYDHGLFSHFLEKNRWATSRFPNLVKSWKKGPRKPLSFIAFILEKIFNLILPRSNQNLFKIQKRALNKKSNQKEEVIISLRIFKSHFDNNRAQTNKKLTKYAKKIKFNI